MVIHDTQTALATHPTNRSPPLSLLVLTVQLSGLRRTDKQAQLDKPNSARAAGAGGSSSTMLKLYTDDSPGLKVDPFVIVVLSLSFIGSIFFLHISAKVVKGE
ncbi:hypothetical protein E3P89_01746 [Wallemia ichthyophaga]|uniref:Protein transport protein Sec61 subunit beta n=1 Tax=Wallemia ichthyophaga TaxID=245174 RepID=A0A4T0FSK2_WALIC|nr:hypothetical protein E3P98_01982 [Wallemia ichthyophaga]TIA91682.1 hypothetical protein E3P97_01897 [Wallemia ichthyophaga]TIA96158.1 hypothetical protein E3P95_03380 [Wallemia ichthyophaga]TIA97235.1 hypothetical protein E3P94_03388 [Wallemia ichthyophaga]TIA98816.1 hypothetical protein E3P96_03071 [Wallemia ichthyophaga]